MAILLVIFIYYSPSPFYLDITRFNCVVLEAVVVTFLGFFVLNVYFVENI